MVGAEMQRSESESVLFMVVALRDQMFAYCFGRFHTRVKLEDWFWAGTSSSSGGVIVKGARMFNTLE
jgi:hypothetical protein